MANKSTYAVTLRRFRYSTDESEYFEPEEVTVYSTASSQAKACANAMFRAAGPGAGRWHDVSANVRERWAVKGAVAC